MKNMKKSLLAMVMAVLVLCTSLLPAFAEDIPYDTYNYDYWNDIFRTPAAYVPQGTLLGTDLTWNGQSLGAFLGPKDMFVAPNGDVYVADTDNHRIVVLDNDLRTVLNVITGFDNAGLADHFNKPTGVAVTEDGWLYVADSQNDRIVVLDENGALRRIVEMPKQASTQTFGNFDYAIHTHVAGMDENGGVTYEQEDGSLYAAVSLPAGSASTLTDENGLTYTVVAVSDALQPFENEMITNAAVTGTPVENGEAADAATFNVKNGETLVKLTAADLDVLDASGAVRARSAYRVLDAQGALAVRAFASEEGVLFADAAGQTMARFNTDDSVSFFGADAAVFGGLKWNDGNVTFCQPSGAVFAEARTDGTVSLYDEDGAVMLTVQPAGEDLLLLNANGGEMVLVKADGSVALRDAEQNELVVLALEGGELAIRDSEGAEYPHTTTNRNGTTLKNEAGDTIASLDKTSNLSLSGAEGGKVALLALSEQGVVLKSTAGKSIAVLAMDGLVRCVKEDGAELAQIGFDGAASVVNGGNVVAAAQGDVIAVGDCISVKRDGSVEFKDAAGAQAAVLSRENGAVRMQESNGAAYAMLTSYAGSVRMQDVLTYAADGSRLAALQEDGSVVEVALTTGSTLYHADLAGRGVVRTAVAGAQTAFTNYDPVPNKDIFLLIGRLLTGPKFTSLTNTRSVWVDEENSFYVVSNKEATKLNSDGRLEGIFGSYKDASGKDTPLNNITEFAVVDNLVYARDDANKIVVLDQSGDLAELIQSNAVEVRDAQGNVVAVYSGYEADGTVDFSGITGLMLLEGKLLVGQSDGSVIVLNRQGEFIRAIENDTVLHIDSQGEIDSEITHVQIGRTQERFTGVTAVSMQDGKLCVMYGDQRAVVMNAAGVAEQLYQKNSVKVTEKGEQPVVITGYEGTDGFVPFADVDGVTGIALNYVRDGKQRQLCVADDRDNLIVFNNELAVTRVTRDADSEVLAADFDFAPMKVAVDYAGRIYCVVQHKVQGIMVFETNGDFTGFFGTIEVSISGWDKFWRKLATKEERSKQALFIPTEFTGIDIDEEGFVYATNVDETGLQAIRRLNPKGEDVIRMGANANLGGDIAINGTGTYSGVSKIVDVVYREKGVYSLLDITRGRIFTYDHEGNLLYIFGGLGTQSGTFSKQVSAIEYADDRILVLDSAQNSVLIFGETEYGRLINEAVGLRYDGDEALAVELWEQVLRLDENNELANTGIGKAYLSAGDNKRAMEYLKRGMNQEYYSVAFKRYRNELLKENIQYVLTGAVALAAGLWVYFKIIKPRLKNTRQGRV